jgi:hypothetical protein
MSGQSHNPAPPDHSDGDTIAIDLRGLESARRTVARVEAGGEKTLTEAERDQLAREIADIERAAAALREGQPALKSWVKPSPPALPKVRPFWLFIGVLWLSTALVTAGAVVAIHSFTG